MAPEVANSANYMKDMQALKTKLQEDFITMHKWEPEDWARRFPGLVDKIRQRVIVGDVCHFFFNFSNISISFHPY